MRFDYVMFATSKISDDFANDQKFVISFRQPAHALTLTRNKIKFKFHFMEWEMKYVAVCSQLSRLPINPMIEL